MAVGVVLEFEGATLEQYDKVIGLMGLTPRGMTAPGSLFHWVAKTDRGLLVTDVWESKATFEAFAKDQIGPFTAEAGITTPPKITFYDVHNYLHG